MFFNFKMKSLLLVLFPLLLVGCSDFLNGKKEPPRVIELSDTTQFKCLEQVPQFMKNFFLGEGQKIEIEQSFNCLASSLTKFRQRTVGSSPNGYTTEELRNFFRKYFLKENELTLEFTAELMKIKRVLVGGSSVYVTKDELIQFVELLGVLREEFIELAPHVKILSLQNTSTKVNWEQVSNATEQLRKSLLFVLGKTQFGTVEYSFEDLKKAFLGFSVFVKSSKKEDLSKLYNTWLPIVEAIKNILLGSKPQISGQAQWQGSMASFVDFYGLALKYHYVFKGNKLDGLEKINEVSQFISQGIKLLLNSHQMVTAGRIAKEDIDNLIEKLYPDEDVDRLNENPLPDKDKQKNIRKGLKKAYQTVLLKILDSEKKGDSLSLLGLEKKHLASLQREFNIWRLQQSFINSLGADPTQSGLNRAELLEAYDKFNKTYVIEKNLTEDPFEQEALAKSWNDLGALLKVPQPLVFSADGRLVLNQGMSELKQNWRSLTESNFIRALSRLLLMGYSQNNPTSMSEAFMTKEKLIEWYDDFKELGTGLKAFDPRTINSGSRSFLEANFFTFSGNGDDFMDQKESYEFVGFLFAAGLSSAKTIGNNEALDHCRSKESLDVFGVPYLKDDCFKKVLKERFSDFFYNLPGLVQYVAGLDEAKWNIFYQHLSDASQVDKQNKALVDTANLRTMVMILHYIENIMILFDQNKSQGLSLDEVYAASPRFMSFIKQISPVGYDRVLKEAFAYLVFYGKAPSLQDLAGFQIDKIKGLPPVERIELVRIFTALKDLVDKLEKEEAAKKVAAKKDAALLTKSSQSKPSQRKSRESR